MFQLSEAWKKDYPGASVGILAMQGVVNPKQHEALDARKQALEKELRSRYAGFDRAALKALPTIQAFNAYYKRFRKSYHVQLQLESIVFKGKSIPRVAALVEAMFMAELKNLLLTAGHDKEALQSPVGIDVADGSERYVRINGQEQTLKAGEMMIRDAEGIMSSVLYGPDYRTRITAATKEVLFTVYAPSGIEHGAIHEHLGNIQANVLLFAPGAEIETMEVYGAP